MGSEWKSIRLADCGKWLSGGTPTKSNTEYWNGEIPWVSPKDMRVFFLEDSEDHITHKAVEESSVSIVAPNTILFVVRSMTLAHTFQIGLTQRELTFNQDLKAICVNSKVDAEYLFYAMRARSNEILGLVDEASHGTKRIKTERLGDYRIPLPPMHKQQKIAEFARNFDDKINLNRRMNRTLEAMARALFKSWFVDFDPVRAKQ